MLIINIKLKMDISHQGVGGFQLSDEGLISQNEFNPFIKSRLIDDKSKISTIKDINA